MTHSMPVPSFLKQYQYELDCWSRLLAFQKEELVFCKNRLAAVVNGSNEEDVLAAAEDFQESFLNQEKIISFLTDEVRRQQQLLTKELYLDGSILPEVVKGQKKVKREMKKGEASFLVVKTAFERFLSMRFWLSS